MKRAGAGFGTWVILVLLLVVLGVFGCSQMNDSAARKIEARGRAQALVIQAQGQARQDTAIATVAVMAGTLPFFGLVLVTVVMAGLVGLCFTCWMLYREERLRQGPAPVIVEPRYLMLPPEVGSRREVYRQLAHHPHLSRVRPAGRRRSRG